ncbi:hypothetical protein DITRI_Ditri10aG0069200 [Diplodiscus trichospermus]
MNCSFAQNCWRCANLDEQNEDLQAGNITANVLRSWDNSIYAWQKPPVQVVKCNIDAEIFREHKLVGFGMVIRDERKDFLSARTLVMVGLMQVKEAEACGLLEELD